MSEQTTIINKKGIPTKIVDSSDNAVSITSDGKMKIKVEDVLSTNATIQGTPNVAVSGTVATNATIQGTPDVSISGTASVTGSVTSDSKTSYSSSQINTINSSTDLDIWLQAKNDNVLLKQWNAVLDTNANEYTITYFQFPSKTSGKCLQRSRAFSSGSPYRQTQEAYSVVDWTFESNVNPSLSIAVSGDVTSPAVSGVSVGTEVATISFSGGFPNTLYSLSSNLNYYYLKDDGATGAQTINNVATGSVVKVCTSSYYPSDRSSTGFTDTFLITLSDQYGLATDAQVTITTQQSAGAVGLSNTKAVKRDNSASEYMYFSWDQPKSDMDNGSGHWFKDGIIWQRTMPFFNWTLSFWFKIDETLTDDTFYNLFGGSSQYAHQAGLKIQDTSGGGYQIRAYDHTTYDLDSSINLEDGDWHHLALCNDSTNINQTHAGSTGAGQQFTNKSGNSQVNVRLFVDGIEGTYNSSTYSHGYIRFNGNYNSTIGGPKNNLGNFRLLSSQSYTSATTSANYGFHFGEVSSSDSDNNLACSIDEFSLHKVNIGKDSSGSDAAAATIAELYNNAAAVDFSSTGWTSGSWATSDLLIWLRCGDEQISGDSLGVQVTSQVSCSRMVYTDDANGYQDHASETLTAKLKIAGGSEADNSVSLTSADSIYEA